MNEAARSGRRIRFITAEACDGKWKLHGDYGEEEKEQPERRDGSAAIKRTIHFRCVGDTTCEFFAFPHGEQRAVVAERGGLFPEEKVNEEPRVHVNHEGADEQVEEQADDGKSGAEERDHCRQRDEEPKEIAEINEQTGAEHFAEALDGR